MSYHFQKAYANLKLQEGIHVLEQFLVNCYFSPESSTKELARKMLLPIPIAAAIKKELITAGLLKQSNGTECTAEGKETVENQLGFAEINKDLYQTLMSSQTHWEYLLEDLLIELEPFFDLRPQVNVEIDQAKCTLKTSVARAILCLREHSLIGKKVLCVGDDDLVSISLGFLLKRIFPSVHHTKTVIDVLDVDERYIDYIQQISNDHHLPINCHKIDLKHPLPERLCDKYDCFYTDPPYTLQGLMLFVSRGVAALKKNKGLPIFLSYAHKSPDCMLKVHQELLKMGLSVKEVTLHFNEYEGAQIIGSKGQMLILQTTDSTLPAYIDHYGGALYTGEMNRKQRKYRCKKCRHVVRVGIKMEFPTIEKLKKSGCPKCRYDRFDLVEKKHKGVSQNTKGKSLHNN
ncbi:MAG TPA: bis-aminopropyl spermidine synthase family protein [Bacillaceae bacterium]